MEPIPVREYRKMESEWRYEPRDCVAELTKDQGAGEVLRRRSGSPADTVGLRYSPVAPKHRSTRTSRVAYHQAGHRLST
jgi:hypothetical protein